jgi:hypothetical protein
MRQLLGGGEQELDVGRRQLHAVDAEAGGLRDRCCERRVQQCNAGAVTERAGQLVVAERAAERSDDGGRTPARDPRRPRDAPVVAGAELAPRDRLSVRGGAGGEQDVSGARGAADRVPRERGGATRGSAIQLDDPRARQILVPARGGDDRRAQAGEHARRQLRVTRVDHRGDGAGQRRPAHREHRLDAAVDRDRDHVSGAHVEREGLGGRDQLAVGPPALAGMDRARARGVAGVSPEPVAQPAHRSSAAASAAGRRAAT